jgi:chaperone modulatory protein CbpM
MSEPAEYLQPEDGRALPLDEFATTAGLEQAEVRELMDYGLLDASGRPGFAELDMRMALVLREAAGLRRDFDLDLFATGLLARSLLRIHALEGELRDARAHAVATTVYTEVSYTAVVSR